MRYRPELNKMCIDCGNPICRRGKQATQRCRKCYDRNRKVFATGNKSSNWKGGVSHKGKYKLIRAANHPFSKANGYIFEHRLIMEKHIGRYLKHTEVIHHLNGNGLDNRIGNLVITNPTEHARRYDAKRIPKRANCLLCDEKPIGRGFCKKHYWSEFLKQHRADKRLIKC